MSFSPQEITRYSRQIIIDGWGLEAQRRLKNAKVTIVGVGALGSMLAGVLAKMGVGTIRIIDDDVVEDVNLSSQLLHWDEDVGKLKVYSVKEKVERINPYVNVEAIPERLNIDNAKDLLAGSDLVLDATDNFGARKIINRACVEMRIPFIHAGVHSFYGQVLTVVPGLTPCLACIFKEVSEESRGCPIILPTINIITAIQVNEAIKLLLGLGTPQLGYMIIYDGVDMEIQKIRVNKNPECEICKNVEPPKLAPFRSPRVCPL